MLRNFEMRKFKISAKVQNKHEVMFIRMNKRLNYTNYSFFSIITPYCYNNFCARDKFDNFTVENSKPLSTIATQNWNFYFERTGKISCEKSVVENKGSL